MNPFNERHKTKGIKPQNPCLMKQTDWVCLQNTYDYSPFGVSLDGRTVESEFYRYGFQRQEKDDDFKGKGNSLNFEYRMHDPRVGRFFALDPITSKFPYNSPYAFCENRPLDGIELEGKEWSVIETFDPESGMTTVVFNVKLKVVNHSNIYKGTQQSTRIMNKAKKEFEKIYSHTDKDNKIEYRATLEFEILGKEDESEAQGLVIELNDVKSETRIFIDDFQNEVTEKITVRGSTDVYNGSSQNNYIPIAVGIDGFSAAINEVARTIAHELGHTAGLLHPWDETNKVNDVKQGAPNVSDKTIKQNLMNSDENPEPHLHGDGSKLTIGQRNSVKEKVKSEQPQTP